MVLSRQSSLMCARLNEECTWLSFFDLLLVSTLLPSSPSDHSYTEKVIITVSSVIQERKEFGAFLYNRRDRLEWWDDSLEAIEEKGTNKWPLLQRAQRLPLSGKCVVWCAGYGRRNVDAFPSSVIHRSRSTESQSKLIVADSDLFPGSSNF